MVLILIAAAVCMGSDGFARPTARGLASALSANGAQLQKDRMGTRAATRAAAEPETEGALPHLLLVGEPNARRHRPKKDCLQLRG